MERKNIGKSLDELDDEVMTDLYEIQHGTDIICHSLIAGTDIEVHLKELDRDYENLKETANSLMAAYRNAWPSKEECFFNEVQIGTRYVAAGVATTVRCIR